jgi:hypothetical protein
VEAGNISSSNKMPWLPWNTNNTNPQFIKAHLTILNLSNFKIIEVMGLGL